MRATTIRAPADLARPALATVTRIVGSYQSDSPDLPDFVFKRLIDIVVSALALVLLLPLFLVIAILVKLFDPGPIFYGHVRLGFRGKDFVCWKFRTMVSDADQILDHYLAQNDTAALEWARAQKLKRDPRVNRLGAFLRRSSLDEIPQLWNVFVGQMSLVGPRPIVVGEISRYGDAFADYTSVRPGITGLWQISGRNNTTYASRVRLDSLYVKSWSLGLDLGILAKTLPVVLTGKGSC
jgi:Undecaprenyl-phosphate galactose phosphotransferase WbaP